MRCRRYDSTISWSLAHDAAITRVIIAYHADTIRPSNVTDESFLLALKLMMIVPSRLWWKAISMTAMIQSMNADVMMYIVKG